MSRFNEDCPFCHGSRLTTIFENVAANVHSYVRCETCGCQGPYVAVETITDYAKFGHDAYILWNLRDRAIAHKIYEKLEKLLPIWKIPVGFTCQIAKQTPDLTIFDLPNLDFQLKLFRDGSWEVEQNGLKESPEGDEEISGATDEE